MELGLFGCVLGWCLIVSNAAPSLLGSLLLESLKDHISTTAQDHCKAIYLHVLTTNNTAINFYENRDFKQHHYLPYYYSIRGVLKDGFTYVLYINGGHPPWTILYPLLWVALVPWSGSWLLIEEMRLAGVGALGFSSRKRDCSLYLGVGQARAIWLLLIPKTVAETHPTGMYFFLTHNYST